MRCGFCNLFTSAHPGAGLVALYLDALRAQAVAVRAAVPGARFARVAIGGGTPTYLDEPELDAVFDVAEGVMGNRTEQLQGLVCSGSALSSCRLR